MPGVQRRGSRGAAAVALAAVALGCALAGPSLSAAVAGPALAAASAGDALDGWRPAAPGDWAAEGSVAVEGEALFGCLEGGEAFWSSGQARALLRWRWCGSPEAAAIALASVWNVAALVPVAGDEALGPGVELIARGAPGDPAAYRLWAQGGHVLFLARDCLGEEDCGVADAAAVSALVPGAPEPVPPSLREPSRDHGDLYLAWAPASAGEWALRFSLPADTTLVPGRPGRCGEGIATSFANQDAERARLFWVDCGSLERAQALAVDYWGSGPNRGEGLDSLLDTGFDGVLWQAAPPEGYVGVYRWWVQGTRYLQLDRTCLAEAVAECGALSAQDALAAAAVSPEPLAPLVDLGRAGGTALVLVGVPVLIFLAVQVPRGIVSRLRNREARGAVAHPRYIAVDALITGQLWARRTRRALAAVLGTGGLIAMVVAAAVAGVPTLLALALLIGPPLLYFGLSAALQLLWPPHRLVRPPRDRVALTPAAVLGGALRAVALLLAFAVVQLYLWAILFSWMDGLKTDAAREQDILFWLDHSEGLSLLYHQLRYVLLLMERSGLVTLGFFLAVAVPLFLAYLLDRLGRRLAGHSLLQALARDRRPYFLYLRGFDEDRLRVDESLGRRGFLELFSVFGRPRFEEVLVEQLSKWGPVIAISGSPQRIADLGAAKASFGGSQWQDQVRQWVGGARAVVLSATPDSVRAGLRWELEHLASREDVPPVMLVVPPWPGADRRRRWEGFLAAVADLPMFRQLVEQPFPMQVNILTYRRDRGWTGYGARRRWDWSYGASIVTALEAGDLEAPSSAESPRMAAMGGS